MTQEFLELLKLGWDFLTKPKKSFLLSLLVVLVPILMFPWFRQILGIAEFYSEHSKMMWFVVLYSVIFLCYLYLEKRRITKEAAAQTEAEANRIKSLLCSLKPDERKTLKIVLDSKSDVVWFYAYQSDALSLAAKGILCRITTGVDPRRGNELLELSAQNAYFLPTEFKKLILELPEGFLGSGECLKQ